MDKEYYIRKWLDGSLTDEELKIFRSMDDYEELSRLSSAVQSFKAPEYKVNQELEKLQERTSARGRVVKMSRYYSWVSAAAVVIIICASFFYFYLNNESLTYANAGEKISLYLPDSSRVNLNASSTITFKQRLWNISRNVRLEGEAFFDVAKGSKFNVYTKDGIISVLGTEFNVKSRVEYFEVSCYEGRVSVKLNEMTEILKPGESLRVVSGEFKKQVDDGSTEPTWIAGESSFDSAPYAEVLGELERQYGIHITKPDMDLGKRFTGKFTHENIDQALLAVTIPFDLEYEIINAEEVAIKSKRN